MITNSANSQIYMLAKRHNNNKRGYLLVNPAQCKHMPASPGESLSMFEQLGRMVKNDCCGERVLVIGFAETATAIGVTVSIAIGNGNRCIQTTREDLPEQYKIVDFNEEHSHATGQKLYCENWAEITENLDRIIFVEDEVTTGKTVLNFIDALRSKDLISHRFKISVASIINGMSESRIKEFQGKNIGLYYLVKIDNTCFERQVSEYDIPFHEDGRAGQTQANMTMRFEGWMDLRLGVSIEEYKEACRVLAERSIQAMRSYLLANNSILVLGVEEFMYPAIYIGWQIQRCCPEVYVHATTRSPILPYSAANYPIRTRYSIKSPYCRERQTFIYNLRKYDFVIIVTDSQNDDDVGINELCHSLSNAGNENIAVIKWVK